MDAEKSIKEQKELLSRRTGWKLRINTEVRIGIFFREELETACEDIKPYAVVMGSQGTTSTEHLFFGSHALYAMRHLMWPLIAVPPGATFSSIKKIGLACDYNNVLTTTPLDEIKLLVHDFNAKLHVVNTGKKLVTNPDVDFQSGLLKEMLSPLNPDYHFITSEYTDEAIMNFAEKNNIDLMIVLPKPHDLLDKLIHKSHTKQMVLHCHVPVMALHQ
jgi:nucleotide-binding universal stress UspA family protein